MNCISKQKNILFYLETIILVYFLIPSVSFSQNPKNRAITPYYWFSAGLGISNLGGSYGINGNLAIKKSLISVRYLYTDEIRRSSFFKKYPIENQWEIGFLYGRYIKTDFSIYTLSAGISITGGLRRGSYLRQEYFMEIYEEKHSNGELSIPIESQIIWNPFPFLGIGMNLFADINRHESIAGVLAAIQLGQFR